MRQVNREKVASKAESSVAAVASAVSEASVTEPVEESAKKAIDASRNPMELTKRVVDWFGEVGRNVIKDDTGEETDTNELKTSTPTMSVDDEELTTKPQSQGGWFRWTNGWRVSESIASATSSWMPVKSDEDVGAQIVEDAERAAVEPSPKDTESDSSDNFLQRVPLPPWIRQRVFGTKETPSSARDEMNFETSLSTTDVNNAISGANETAANVTSAALDKLNSVLIGIEEAEMRVEKDVRLVRDQSAVKALRDSLRDARSSANEARSAAEGLEAAVREVNRAQAAIRSEAGAKGEEALKALEVAKSAVIQQAKSSNNAVADALRQVSYVATRVEKLGSLGDESMGETLSPDVSRPESARRGLLGAIANARESAQDALVASELTQTISRLTSFGLDKSKRADFEGLSTMVRPALQKVVANALRPVGDDEIGDARLACALSAWIYYLPQMQHALPRNRLRLITSSLDENRVIPSSEFRAGKVLIEEAATKADRALEEAMMANRVSAVKDAKREVAAMNAAAEAAALAAEALELAAELRESAEEEGSLAKAVDMAENAKKLSMEAQKRMEEASKIAEENKQRLKKWEMQRELAVLESEMRKTVLEQHKQREAERIQQDRMENATLPVNFCVAAQDDTATLWVVVEGSTNIASWQTNFTFQSVTFEDDFDVKVHRGAYAAAQTMYRRVEEAVKAHVTKHGARARVRITGHSIGGSIATLLALMLLMRNGAPRYALADVWLFGAPYCMLGGDALLARLGLPRTFIRSVMMGDDVVPRSFSCYYPKWAQNILDSGPFNVDTSSANWLEEDMFYTPMGTLFMLQAANANAKNSEHPLLPSGPGLYCLDGDGLFETLSTRARLTDDDDGEESWLNRRPMRVMEDSEENEEPQRVENLRLHQIACLTQSDAALTASLILNTLREDQDALLDADGGVAAMLSARGREAAQRVLLNTPHPLTILSKPGAYGDRGIISRMHNPFNYAKALSVARKAKPRRGELIAAQRRTSIDGAPASGNDGP